MKKNRLKKMKIDEVSLVDRGANQEAFVLLYKREKMNEEDKKDVNEEELDKNETINSENDNQSNVSKNEFTEALAISETLEDLWKLQDALRDAIREIASSDEGDKASRISDVVDSYAMAIKQKISYNEQALAKAEKELSFVMKLNEKQKDVFSKMNDEEKEDILSKNDEQAISEITKKAEEVDVIEFEGEKIYKSQVGESVYNKFVKMKSEKEEIEKKYQDEIAKRELETAISKAEEMLKDYPLEAEEKLSIYKAYASLDDSVKANLDKLFKSGASALEGLTVQKSNPAPSEVREPLTEVEKVMKEIKEQKENK